MMSRDDAAIESTAHRLEIVLKHSTIGILQKHDSLISCARQQWTQRALQDRDHHALSILAKATGGLAEGAGESITKTAQRLEAAVKSCVIQGRAFANAHEGSRQAISATPRAEAH